MVIFGRGLNSARQQGRLRNKRSIRLTDWNSPMKKKRLSKRRREYNVYFAALPTDKQDAQLGLMMRWLLRIIRGDNPPPPTLPQIK